MSIRDRFQQKLQEQLVLWKTRGEAGVSQEQYDELMRAWKATRRAARAKLTDLAAVTPHRPPEPPAPEPSPPKPKTKPKLDERREPARAAPAAAAERTATRPRPRKKKARTRREDRAQSGGSAQGDEIALCASGFAPRE